MNSYADKKNIWSISIVAILFFLGGCATHTSVRQHPDFVSAKRKIETIAVIAPDVEYTRIVFTGDNERIPEKEAEIARHVLESFEMVLKEKGYVVFPFVSEKAAFTDKNIKFELQQLRTAYNEAAKQLYERPATEEESVQYRVTLGPAVNSVANAANADVLLIARYVGFEKSGGQQTKDVISGALLGALTGVVAVSAKSGGVLEAALVDGTTGDVLWVNRGAGARNKWTGGVNSRPRAVAGYLLQNFPTKNRISVKEGASSVTQSTSVVPASR